LPLRNYNQHTEALVQKLHETSLHRVESSTIDITPNSRHKLVRSPGMDTSHLDSASKVRDGPAQQDDDVHTVVFACGIGKGLEVVRSVI
jgi:hypothetical protein